MTCETEVTIVANGFQAHYITNLVNALASVGIEVSLVGSDIYDPLLLDPRVRLLNLRGSHERDVPPLRKVFRVTSYYARLARYALKTRSKVFHIQWLRFNPVDGILVPLFLKALGKKVVYTAHNPLPHLKENFYHRFIFSLVHRAPDAIVVHSRYVSDRLRSLFGLDPRSLHLVPLPVYRFRSDPALSRDRARGELGLRPSDRVALFFGRITEYKGLDVLLSAFKIARPRVPDLKLVVAGRLEPSYRKTAERLLREWGTEEGLITRLSFLSDREVEVVFKAADVVVLPYREATQSGVLFSAYAFRRPVIASDEGAFREDVEEGKTGYVFRSGDHEDLARAFERFFGGLGPVGKEVEDRIAELERRGHSWSEAAVALSSVYRGLAFPARKRQNRGPQEDGEKGI